MDALFTAEEIMQATGGRWLGDRRFVGKAGIFSDTRQSGEGKAFIAFSGENFDAHDFLDKAVSAGAAALIIEERKQDRLPDGNQLPVLTVPDSVRAYQALGRFHRLRFPDLKVAAVTGSVGKTSVKEMLRAIFCEAVGPEAVLYTIGNTNNQIGVVQNLLHLTADHRFAVIEMGTNHFGEISPLTMTAKPDGALVNSIAPCHLENLLSLEGVAREKSAIYSGLPANGCAVYPAVSPANEILTRAAAKFNACTFGENSGTVQVEYLGGNLDGSVFRLRFPDGKKFTVSWHLAGKHQALNAAAAATLAYALGVAPEVIAAGLPHTELPGMRAKRTEFNGVICINDAYNANPQSMRASFAWLKEFADPARLVLVLGEMRELGACSDAEHAAILAEARMLFPCARIVTVGKFSPSEGVYHFDTAIEAAPTVAGLLRSGDLLFAKASRGIALENALPEAAR